MIAEDIQKNTKTRQTRVLNTIYTLAGGALLLVLFLLLKSENSIPKNINNVYDGIVTIGENKIAVSIADSENEREQGLSNTPYLEANSGKLFVFDTARVYGFWMKEMNYPIDIIWIDQNNKIIDITRDLKPETYPEVFYPSSDVLYVLEVNAGFSTLNNISENQLVTIGQELVF
ncbi:DUF192 domain-containing protein [Candidatus Nomurabacteria bacterium]|nr:DUF192 domain-containing protein [Candidatus Nomurabacteria bacterium]